MRGHRYFGAEFGKDFSRHLGGGSPPKPAPPPPAPDTPNKEAEDAASQVARMARLRRGRYSTILTNPTGGDYNPTKPAGAATLGGA